MKGRQGFTLLELMMALALSAMLLVGVMAVIVELGASGMKESNVGNPSGNDGLVMTSLVRLLGEDIAQSEALDTTKPNRLILMGHCGLDGTSRARLHRSVMVEYRLEPWGGRTWLVRRQRLLDVLSNENIQRDLICDDVSGFGVTPEVNTFGGKAESSEDAASSARSEDETVSSTQVSTNRQARKGLIYLDGQWVYLTHAPDAERERLSRESNAEHSGEVVGGRITKKEQGSEGGKPGFGDRSPPGAENKRGVLLKLRLDRNNGGAGQAERIITVFAGGNS